MCVCLHRPILPGNSSRCRAVRRGLSLGLLGDYGGAPAFDQYERHLTMRDVQRWLKLCTKSKTFGKAEKAQVTKERVNVDDLPVEEVSKIVQEELQAFAAYHGVDMEHLLQAYERAPFATKSEAAVSEKNRRDDACWQQVPVVVASRLQGSAAPTSQDVFDVQQWIDRHIFKPRGGYRFNTIVDGDDGPYRVPNLHGSEIDDVIISLRPLVSPPGETVEVGDLLHAPGCLRIL